MREEKEEKKKKKKEKRKREVVLWSEHDETTGMIRFAISHKVSLFNPIFQQTMTTAESGESMKPSNRHFESPNIRSQ